MLPPITSKEHNYVLWQQGVYGNRPRVWLSYDEYRTSGFGGLVSMRYSGAHGGGWCQYEVPRDETDAVRARWITEGPTESW